MIFCSSWPWFFYLFIFFPLLPPPRFPPPPSLPFCVNRTFPWRLYFSFSHLEHFTLICYRAFILMLPFTDMQNCTHCFLDYIPSSFEDFSFICHTLPFHTSLQICIKYKFSVALYVRKSLYFYLNHSLGIKFELFAPFSSIFQWKI